jgi:nickel/cobalt transporter (NicO) family protein
MSIEIWSLAGVAVTVGCLHTLLGPDHYLPFVAMSRVGGWSMRKTLIVTWLCGLGHVASSILLGLIGIGLGLAVHRLEGIEETRGGIAGWLLIGFGFAYLTWGIVHALRGRVHSHPHVHSDGTAHVHAHQHNVEHLHPHPSAPASSPSRMTPWILFTIFLFGPCEPLIPILMYPAAEASVSGVILVTVLFSLATLLTMTVMVCLLVGGFSLIRLSSLERYSHAMAGGLVLACGVAIKLGL